MQATLATDSSPPIPTAKLPVILKRPTLPALSMASKGGMWPLVTDRKAAIPRHLAIQPARLMELTEPRTDR